MLEVRFDVELVLKSWIDNGTDVWAARWTTQSMSFKDSRSKFSILLSKNSNSLMQRPKFFKLPVLILWIT